MLHKLLLTLAGLLFCYFAIPAGFYESLTPKDCLISSIIVVFCLLAPELYRVGDAAITKCLSTYGMLPCANVAAITTVAIILIITVTDPAIDYYTLIMLIAPDIINSIM